MVIEFIDKKPPHLQANHSVCNTSDVAATRLYLCYWFRRLHTITAGSYFKVTYQKFLSLTIFATPTR
jgi:hypothetical protein